MNLSTTFRSMSRNLGKTIAGLGAAALLGFASVGAHAADDAQLYTEFARSAPVAEFEQYLKEANLAGVIPTQQLARTASDWERCSGPRFELPPKTLWPEVRKVLSLVAELKKRSIFNDVEAVSAYRNAKLNACSGGAAHSAHTAAYALDIAAAKSIDTNLLCSFWRNEGKTWKMGLSRYPSGRIHVDTTGYRTWGANHKKGSSVCG
jgi:hypothetical protein